MDEYDDEYDDEFDALGITVADGHLPPGGYLLVLLLLLLLLLLRWWCGVVGLLWCLGWMEGGLQKGREEGGDQTVEPN